MMIVFVSVAVGLVIVYLLLSFVFPQQFFNFLLKSVRKLCGLKSRSIDVDGRTWHYLEGGPADGEVLLLLHGFGGDKDNWPLYARYFNGSYRIIVPDLPGFGDSDIDFDADYTVTIQTERLHAFVHALNVGNLHIAGNSMGGAIALKYALDYPDDLQSLTLICNAGVIGEEKSELELRSERGENPLVVSTMAEFEELIRFIMYRRMPVPAVVKRVLSDRAIERREFLDRIFWSLFDEFRREPLNEQLPQLAVPTLIVWGRQDRLIDVSCADVMAASIPNNRCVVFDNAGHIPMIERPAATAAAHVQLMEAIASA